MIIDFHTHIFPPEVVDQRERYVTEDPTFRLLYENPKAKLATAADLLRSMDDAGIDVSVALGFQWTNETACRLHNDYLLEVAESSDGRIVPFCILPLASPIDAIEAELERCVSLGAGGFGELRPENTAFELDDDAGHRLAVRARALGSLLVFHVSEPVGHVYAGKEGLDVGTYYRFAARSGASEGRENEPHAPVRSIGAHWGGGLPFYASMPEVRELFTAGLHVDTAASSLLYDESIYSLVAGLIGAERILFGSDYPLLSQKRSRQRIEASDLDAASKNLVLGENARRLLALP